MLLTSFQSNILLLYLIFIFRELIVKNVFENKNSVCLDVTLNAKLSENNWCLEVFWILFSILLLWGWIKRAGWCLYRMPGLLVRVLFSQDQFFRHCQANYHHSFHTSAIFCVFFAIYDHGPVILCAFPVNYYSIPS